MYYIKTHDLTIVEIDNNKPISLYIKADKGPINAPIIFDQHDKMLEFMSNYETKK